MKLVTTGNWGLRLLALILAIVIYHALKSDASHAKTENDRTFLKHN